MVKTLYHGTSSDFERLRLVRNGGVRRIDSRIERVTPCAFFFTASIETAWRFAFSRADRGPKPLTFPYVWEVEVELGNMLDLVIRDGDWRTISEQFPNWSNMGGINPLRSDVFAEATGADPDSWGDVHISLDDPDTITGLQFAGYDGIVFREEDNSETYCLFECEGVRMVRRVEHKPTSASPACDVAEAVGVSC